MDVDDATREGIDEEVRYHGQEACEDDEVDVELLQERQDDVGVVELRLGNHGSGNGQTPRTFEGESVSTVAHDECRADVLAAAKILYDVLTIGAAARHENSDGYQSERVKSE